MTFAPNKLRNWTTDPYSPLTVVSDIISTSVASGEFTAVVQSAENVFSLAQ